MQLPIDYRQLSQAKRRDVRNEYVRLQDGKCAHCGELLTGTPSDEVMSHPINHRLFPEGMFRWPVHLHHCHKTGMTIGAVHCRCNAYLWQYRGE